MGVRDIARLSGACGLSAPAVSAAQRSLLSDAETDRGWTLNPEILPARRPRASAKPGDKAFRPVLNAIRDTATGPVYPRLSLEGSRAQVADRFFRLPFVLFLGGRGDDPGLFVGRHHLVMAELEGE
jgi:hypothetical protein